ncbi:uncharacterized protein FIBRA_02227 [Fibroporia radiculosa]|uniref:SAP domain-containing protein n=1 Tax=Fibroporia radiculosa TaxID=599839 RepID=J4H1Q8_9APHY|nr:uncharacterized protein FIBRA_02227 [Fibroporia radiculosa]CCM00199.1 predicted protein [Fibroporia radiculosa]
MAIESQIPWEKLKGDTMKAIFRDLGLPHAMGNKDEMVERLQAVERDGLNAVAERFGDAQAGSSHPRSRPRQPFSQVSVQESASTRRSVVEVAVPMKGPTTSKRRVEVAVPMARVGEPNSKQQKKVFDGVVLAAPLPDREQVSREQMFIGVVMPPVERPRSAKRKAGGGYEAESPAGRREQNKMPRNANRDNGR